ncbi:2-octaprenyl-6-methoxyphenol hydroxylase [Legionella birminghamensis]|uniref:2-octaprenyl-6-methoxyphenol hydroxylase n=1 Tax=Legionella birminghamensis TaxID=28083 RepID=A0A378I616_9GAMM|nr:NAD(P)/FAD-dependent oxidoreductase [Legionella birminghamensis]KTC72506.1 2-octaprenyl-6-methoxyphenol hydroxylase [Legionella birminghamensis]STX30638.1 2-octaprenyl-6-methoxyphenol hydroxylase [Legionella birminghamensis]
MLKVAVIGCGIAGPAAALFLKRLDAEVSIFDRVENLTPVGSGFLLQPAGLDVLNQLEIAQTLIPQGAPIAGLLGINHRQKVVLDLRYCDLVDYHFGLGIHRAVLYRELFAKMQASGVRIINPCEIVSLKQTPDSVYLHDNCGHMHGPFDCVVVADGSRSGLRQYLEVNIRVKPYEWGALWSIARDNEGQFNQTLEQIYRRTEIMAGILPIGFENQQLLLSFFWSMRKDYFPQWLNTPFGEWKKEVLGIWPALEPVFKQFNSHQQFALASYADASVYPWHDRRVVIIGDAAHGMSPQLGQGANLSLIDARTLYDCLSQFPLQEALSQYTQRRRSQLRYYQQASRFITPWFQSSHESMGILRDWFHGLFCKTPFLKQQMLRTLACMKTGYFSSLPLHSFTPLNKKK